jgi:MscS family membrane protein
VIIPNGKLADMRIESLGPRDRIRFATKLSLARDTEVTQIEALVKALRDEIRAHPAIHKDDVLVHLSGVGESSFDVDVAAPVETTDAIEFAKIREQLLLTCVRMVAAQGAKLAVPARSIVTAAAVPVPARAPSPRAD